VPSCYWPVNSDRGRVASVACYCSCITFEGIPEEATPAAGRLAWSPRSTPEIIVELQVQATAFTLAAIAVVNHDVTQFVFAIDDDPSESSMPSFAPAATPSASWAPESAAGPSSTTPGRWLNISTTPTR